jgi:hypothetical protein
MTNDQRMHIGIGAMFACFSTSAMLLIFRQGALAIGVMGEGACWTLFMLYAGWLSMKDDKRTHRHVRYYSVAEDFTRFPEGRALSDGPISGEAFRETLVPILENENRLVLNLDGTMGFGSSWLEGCFMDLESVAPIERLIIVCEDSSLVRECWDYIHTKTAAATRQRRLSNEEAERRFPERRY